MADTEGIKLWLSVITELKNRGLQDSTLQFFCLSQKQTFLARNCN
jgi:transposase-like protein